MVRTGGGGARKGESFKAVPQKEMHSRALPLSLCMVTSSGDSRIWVVSRIIMGGLMLNFNKSSGKERDLRQ